MTRSFIASKVWLNHSWTSDVLLTVGPDGHWLSINQHPDANQKRQALAINGYVLPGISNTHSHAFQRAIVGMTEQMSPDAPTDNFWTWRAQMYRMAQRLSPDAIERIATQLYGELIRCGYTHVCEFNYLHHDCDGGAYDDPLTLSMAHVRAAKSAGIGLTLLPTLYMRSGFDASGLRDDQRRFASTPQSVLKIANAINAMQLPLVNAGVAIHSLRAVDMRSLNELAVQATRRGLPIHIHIAEQMQEVNDCILHHGCRPIDYLMDHCDVNANWNLVHATHASLAEIARIKAAGASIVICPSTEANLGDGIVDLPAIMQAQINWSIGSDSHVSRSWVDELRLLEYSQRLQLRERNIAARYTEKIAQDHASSGAALLVGAASGASSATGRAVNAIALGQRADFSVWGEQRSFDVSGMTAPTADDYYIDQLIFTSPSPQAIRVYVAGNLIHPDSEAPDLILAATR